MFLLIPARRPSGWRVRLIEIADKASHMVCWGWGEELKTVAQSTKGLLKVISLHSRAFSPSLLTGFSWVEGFRRPNWDIEQWGAACHKEGAEGHPLGGYPSSRLGELERVRVKPGAAESKLGYVA